MSETSNSMVAFFQNLMQSLQPIVDFVNQPGVREVFMVIGTIGGIVFTVVAAWYAFSKKKKAYDAGELPEEVIMHAIIFDEDDKGKVYLKPRTVQSAMPIERAFPNPVLVQNIIAATKECKGGAPESPFIRLNDPKEHKTFMKRVVDIASGLGGVGHIIRMCGGDFIEHICYVCVTFSPDGEHRKIRLDLVSEDDLKLMRTSSFVDRITSRDEEGSHADLVSILKVCAEKEFGKHRDETRSFVRRVSISVPAYANGQSITLADIAEMIDRILSQKSAEAISPADELA